MLSLRLIFYPLLLIGLFSLGGCKPANTTESAELEVTAVDHYFSIPLDEKTLQLQVALSQSELARGLMFREALEKDHGMLFVFDKPGPRSFWMRNTSIKLDLAYLSASGEVLEIHKLYPYSETPAPSRSQEIQLVIEMNRGWFKANDLGVGAQLDLTAVTEAIVSRGFDPENFGL